jgi:GABA(A) receptor-associated protein
MRYNFKSKCNFKNKYNFEDRFIESSRIMFIYPDRLPIICERSISAPSDCPDIDKKKYLIPNDLTVGQFIYVIRQRLQLHPEKAIFLLINGIIPTTSQHMNAIYNLYKDDDGFLYISYTFENTFG